jgi:hypothetical protein
MRRKVSSWGSDLYLWLLFDSSAVYVRRWRSGEPREVNESQSTFKIESRLDQDPLFASLFSSLLLFPPLLIPMHTTRSTYLSVPVLTSFTGAHICSISRRASMGKGKDQYDRSRAPKGHLPHAPMILQGRPLMTTCPPFRRAEHWMGKVLEAPAEPPTKSSSC